MRVQNLHFKRDKFSLGPIQIEFETSGLYFIQGPNGCGKTSLLRLLMGRLRPQTGEVTERKYPYAYLGAENFFFEDLSIHENYRLLKKLGPSPIAEFNKNNLLAFRDRNFSQLSEGQAQRARLELLLCFDFPCFFLDEAFSHLDPKERESLQKQCQVRSESRLFIMSIHQDSEIFGNPKGVIRL